MGAMARQARLCLPGQAHLVLQPANAAVFVEPADYQDYVQRLASTAAQSEVQVHAYALLPDSVWLVLTPADCAGLSALMQTLARCASRRRGLGSGLWRGRYRSALLEQDSWLLPALCAVDLAPQLAGVTQDAAAWPWSSLAHHVGRQPSGWLREAPPYWELGNTPYAREAAYAGLLAGDVASRHWPALLRALQAAGALGGADYIEWAEQRIGRRLRPGSRGRPRSSGEAPCSVPIKTRQPEAPDQ